MNSWFSNIGNNQSSSISSIKSWDDWPGPEDELVAKLNDDLILIYESLALEPNEESQLISSINDKINCFKKFTPYQDNEDA